MAKINPNVGLSHADLQCTHWSTGQVSPVLGHDGMPHIVDYVSAIGMGKVQYHVPFYMLGYNPDLLTVREDICEWGGTYIRPPDTGIQMLLKSTSDQDKAGGTGVSSVSISYLDASFNEVTISLATNGTTGVLTPPVNITRINFFNSNAGAVNANGEIEAVGNITLKNTGETVTYAQITATNNVSRHGIFTIPNGMVGYLTGGYISCGGTSVGRFVRAMLRATCDRTGTTLTPNLFQFKRQLLMMDAAAPTKFEMPVRVPARCDIKYSAIDENGSYVACFVEGFYEPI